MNEYPYTLIKSLSISAGDDFSWESDNIVADLTKTAIEFHQPLEKTTYATERLSSYFEVSFQSFQRPGYGVSAHLELPNEKLIEIQEKVEAFNIDHSLIDKSSKLIIHDINEPNQIKAIQSLLGVRNLGVAFRK